MELALKLLGILFGVLARTLAPYLRKVKQRAGFSLEIALREEMDI